MTVVEYEDGGAENLDYSSYTYEELRAAVYGVGAEAIRVGVNEWTDLKRRLDERVGTLRVVTTKLEPDWQSPGGRDALGRLRGQLSWMEEFARVAGWNQDQLTAVHEAYHEALKAMRELDAQPDRPNPSPGQSPGSGNDVHPAQLNWKQPYAATIANALYRRMAVAAASMARPPQEPTGIKPGSALGEDGFPGDGAVAPRHGSGSQPGPGLAQRLSDAPHASKTGGESPGLVLGGYSRADGAPGTPDVRAPVARSRASGTGASKAGRGGQSTMGGSVVAGRSGGRVGSSAGGAPGVGRGSVGATAPGTIGRPGGPPGPVLDPGTRTLGGGLRPPPGTPVDPGSGTGGRPPVGGLPPGAGGAGQGGRPGRKKPGYERGELDTFVDDRRARPPGGQLAAPRGEDRIDPLPGMLGAQKYRPVEEPAGRWELPEAPTSVPEGFPEELRDFKQKDGTEFQVRRRSRGT